MSRRVLNLQFGKAHARCQFQPGIESKREGWIERSALAIDSGRRDGLPALVKTAIVEADTKPLRAHVDVLVSNAKSGETLEQLIGVVNDSKSEAVASDLDGHIGSGAEVLLRVIHDVG